MLVPVDATNTARQATTIAGDGRRNLGFMMLSLSLSTAQEVRRGGLPVLTERNALTDSRQRQLPDRFGIRLRVTTVGFVRVHELPVRTDSTRRRRGQQWGNQLHRDPPR